MRAADNPCTHVIYPDPRIEMPQAPQKRQAEIHYYVIMMDIKELSENPGGYNASRTNSR